jgi:hypothetical protein
VTAGSHALGPVHRRLRHGCQLWGPLGVLLTGCIAPSTFLLDHADAVPERADRMDSSDLGDDRVDAG